jgi:hypothetical protein
MRTVSSLKNFQKILRPVEALLILEIDLWFWTRCQSLRHECRKAKVESRKFGSYHFYWRLFHTKNTTPEIWINHLNQLLAVTTNEVEITPAAWYSKRADSSLLCAPFASSSTTKPACDHVSLRASPPQQ